MAKKKAIRKAARRTIVESVDIRAMLTCAERAEASGDSVDAEFWWTEVATAPAPAGDDSGPRETGETWSQQESAETDEVTEPANDDDELAILQALERGTIGVDEAARRLERARR